MQSTCPSPKLPAIQTRNNPRAVLPPMHSAAEIPGLQNEEAR